MDGIGALPKEVRQAIGPTKRIALGVGEEFSIVSSSYAIGDGAAQVIEDGYSLTNLDPAVTQNLRVECRIHNANPGFWTPAWDGAVTVYNMTDQKMVDWKSDTRTLGTPLDPHLNYLNMSQLLSLGKITKPTNLRINIMANQDANAPQPDVSLWKVRV